MPEKDLLAIAGDTMKNEKMYLINCTCYLNISRVGLYRSRCRRIPTFHQRNQGGEQEDVELVRGIDSGIWNIFLGGSKMVEIYDLIIIGSGPAGLSATIYAQRAKLTTLVIEANYVSGGQMMNTYRVDNYPGFLGISGMDLGTTFRRHADQMGSKFVMEKVLDLELKKEIKTVRTKKHLYQTRTLILATGTDHRKLQVPGEDEFEGFGVSYCATCDGVFFKDKVVSVVGGGDVAVEDAIFLARCCKKVYLIHRRDSLCSARILQERLMALPNVEIIWDSMVRSIEGVEQVAALQLEHLKTGEKEKLSVDGCFIAVGILPNNVLIQGKLELDEGGYIKASEDGVTSVQGVFAAGNVRTKQLRQIVTAVSDGANCVTSVQNYLMTKNI